jgi:hypothetical protein
LARQNRKPRPFLDRGSRCQGIAEGQAALILTFLECLNFPDSIDGKQILFLGIVLGLLYLSEEFRDLSIRVAKTFHLTRKVGCYLGAFQAEKCTKRDQRNCARSAF